MNVYDARWNNAKRLAERLQQYAKDNNCFIVFDNDFEPSELVINEEERTVVFESPGCAVCIYDGNPEFDDGANTPIGEWNEEMKQRIRVFKEIDFWR